MKKNTIIIFIIFMTIIFLGKSAYADYTNKQIKQAEGIMYAVKQYANIYEEDGHLVVEFHTFIHPYNMNSRYQLIKTISNADCIIKGKARSIYFYNPDKKQIGQADVFSGIRLINQ